MQNLKGPIQKVQCCSCDKHQNIYNTQKLKLPGLMSDFFVCNNCLTSLPALKPEMLEFAVKSEVSSRVA